MLQAFQSVLGFFWALLRIPLIALGLFLVIFGFLCLVEVYRCKKAGMRRPAGVYIPQRPVPLLRRLFVLLPRQFVRDLFSRSPEFFRHQGCIIFTGRQGNGKTVAMAHQARLWRMEYPKAKCLTNFALKGEDAVLDDWRKLVGFKNGIRGVIACIDETQNWFSSNMSKDFPPEMLEVITQNRKNRRVILGTAQSFNRLAKPLREQATEVRRCSTFLGCLTVVHRVCPELNSAGDVVEWKHRGWYWFVHDQALRDSYDTWKVIESLQKSGFQPRQQMAEIPSIAISVQPGKR